MHSYSPQSKVWVYQSNRVFGADEINTLIPALEKFTQEWTAHNLQLKATAEIRENRFIVLLVDETQATASGCSIDKSVHFLKEIENKWGVSLFNRQLISYKTHNETTTDTLANIETLFENGSITPETLVFNTLVTNKAQLDTEWLLPIKQTWMARYIHTQTP